MPCEIGATAPELPAAQHEMLLHADGAIQDDRVVPENGAAGTLGKIFYLVFIGWWLGLLYAIVGL